MSAAVSQTDRLSAALSGRYRIERELGAGGMATVYLAEDLKHDRKVAIKVLKPELAAVLGAERFVVEIKTTAAMSHPHILPLFDSGTADGFLFYVMPYIQGETIREKLNRETQFGVDEAVRIARETADALDYAHRQGVIHRDIKPENILLHDGRAMVMDFGIALAVSAAAGGRMTETGLSLGTPHYMSPEQATAEKEITARSDQYSLASVLYEMLAGDPPFVASAAQAVIMKIITEPAPSVTERRKNVPANVDAALGKALEKLPADRFDSAKAFADALGNTSFTTAGRGATSRERLASPGSWSRTTRVMAAIAVVLALALGITLSRRPTTDNGSAGMVQFALVDDASLRLDALSTRPFAFSPDGRSIVFRASGDSVGARLWIRSLGDPRARPIEGTQGGMNPTFSPNGEWIAFITENNNMRKVRIAGGSASPVVRTPGRTAALAWGEDDEIFFEQLGGSENIHRVAASGGRLESVVPLDSASGEEGQRRPFIIPGTRTIVYASSIVGEAESVLALFRLSDGRRARLDLPGIGALGYFDGRLVYSRADGTLMAVPLDVGGMKTTGAAVPLEPRVRANVTGTAVALSRQGTLAFHSADADGVMGLALLDTSGQRRTLRGTFAQPGLLSLSPDGKRVAIGSRPDDPGWRLAETASTAQEVHVLDLTTQVATRLRTTGHALYLSWSADGKYVYAPRVLNDAFEVMRVPLDGAPESKLVTMSARVGGAVSATPDGRALVFAASLSGGGGSGMFRAWLDGNGRVDTLMLRSRDQVDVYLPRVSPDGKSVAFVDRGSAAVFVKSLDGGGALQVSVLPSGFRRPVAWGPDSRHVYYVGANGLNIIEIATAPTLRVVDRKVNAAFRISGIHDVSSNGRTFIALDGETGSDVRVAVNWLGEARRAWSKP